MKNLTKGNIFKTITIFAIPLFIGQLFQLFYSLVDTRIVGSILGETSLAAVGSTSSLCDLVYNLINGFTCGAAIIIATFFGKGDRNKLKKAIGGTILLSICICLIISMFGIIFMDPLLSWLNISEELLPEAISYISVIFWGLIASTLYMMCASILRAIGDSFTPLIFLIIAALFNVLLDIIFIKYLYMGVFGAAFATIISQSISAILCFIYMFKKYPILHLTLRDFNFDRPLLCMLIKSGLSMSFMISFVHFGTLALQTCINTFGTNIIVAHTAARKATSIFMLPFSAFGTTLATFCGQNYGAGEYKRIKSGISISVIIVWIWCILVIITAFLFSPFIIRSITGCSIPEVINTASLYLKVNTSFYFIPAVICLFRNSMQGFGETNTPIFSSLLELIGKIIIAFFLAPVIGYMGIIVAEPIVWIIMVIPLIVRMKRFFSDNISSN